MSFKRRNTNIGIALMIDMKTKTLLLLLLISSLFGYLEWGGDNHIFLFEAEATLFYKLFTSPTKILHPLIILPIVGQFLLLLCLFRKTPNRKVAYFGIVSIGVLLGFMFFVGIISFNLKIIGSTIPFLIIAYFTFLHLKNR